MDFVFFNCRQRFLDFVVDLRTARIAKPAPSREARDWRFEKPERVAAPAGETPMALLPALGPAQGLPPPESPQERQGSAGNGANQAGLRSNLGNLINAASLHVEPSSRGGRRSKLAADEH